MNIGTVKNKKQAFDIMLDEDYLVQLQGSYHEDKRILKTFNGSFDKDYNYKKGRKRT